MYQGRGPDHRDIPQPPHLLINQNRFQTLNNNIQHTFFSNGNQQMGNVYFNMASNHHDAGARMVRYQRMSVQSEEGVYYMFPRPQRSSISNHPSACHRVAQRHIMNQRFETSFNQNCVPNDLVHHFELNGKELGLCNENEQRGLPLGEFERMTREHIGQNTPNQAYHNRLFRRVINDRLEKETTDRLLDQYDINRNYTGGDENNNVDMDGSNSTMKSLHDHTYSQSCENLYEDRHIYSPAYVTNCQNSYVRSRDPRLQNRPSCNGGKVQNLRPIRPKTDLEKQHTETNNGKSLLEKPNTELTTNTGKYLLEKPDINSKLVRKSPLLQSALKDIQTKDANLNKKDNNQKGNLNEGSKHAELKASTLALLPVPRQKLNEPSTTTVKGDNCRTEQNNSSTATEKGDNYIYFKNKMVDQAHCISNNVQNVETLQRKVDYRSFSETTNNVPKDRLLHDHKKIDCNGTLKDINPESSGTPKPRKKETKFMNLLGDVLKLMFSERKKNSEGCKSDCAENSDERQKFIHSEMVSSNDNDLNKEHSVIGPESGGKLSLTQETENGKSEIGNENVQQSKLSNSKTTDRNVFQCFYKQNKNLDLQSTSKNSLKSVSQSESYSNAENFDGGNIDVHTGMEDRNQRERCGNQNRATFSLDSKPTHDQDNNASSLLDHDCYTAKVSPVETVPAENDFSFLERGYCPIALPLGCYEYDDEAGKDQNNNEVMDTSFDNEDGSLKNPHMAKLCNDRYDHDRTEFYRPWIIHRMDEIPKPTVWKEFLDKMDRDNSIIVKDATVDGKEINKTPRTLEIVTIDSPDQNHEETADVCLGDDNIKPPTAALLDSRETDNVIELNATNKISCDYSIESFAIKKGAIVEKANTGEENVMEFGDDTSGQNISNDKLVTECLTTHSNDSYNVLSSNGTGIVEKSNTEEKNAMEFGDDTSGQNISNNKLVTECLTTHSNDSYNVLSSNGTGIVEKSNTEEKNAMEFGDDTSGQNISNNKLVTECLTTHSNDSYNVLSSNGTAGNKPAEIYIEKLPLDPEIIVPKQHDQVVAVTSSCSSDLGNVKESVSGIENRNVMFNTPGVSNVDGSQNNLMKEYKRQDTVKQIEEIENVQNLHAVNREKKSDTINNPTKRPKRNTIDNRLMEEAMQFICNGKSDEESTETIIDCLTKQSMSTRQNRKQTDTTECPTKKPSRKSSNSSADGPQENPIKKKRGRPLKVMQLREKQKLIEENLKKMEFSSSTSEDDLPIIGDRNEMKDCKNENKSEIIIADTGKNQQNVGLKTTFDTKPLRLHLDKSQVTSDSTDNDRDRKVDDGCNDDASKNVPSQPEANVTALKWSDMSHEESEALAGLLTLKNGHTHNERNEMLTNSSKTVGSVDKSFTCSMREIGTVKEQENKSLSIEVDISTDALKSRHTLNERNEMLTNSSKAVGSADKSVTCTCSMKSVTCTCSMREIGTVKEQEKASLSVVVDIHNEATTNTTSETAEILDVNKLNGVILNQNKEEIITSSIETVSLDISEDNNMQIITSKPEISNVSIEQADDIEKCTVINSENTESEKQIQNDNLIEFLTNGQSEVKSTEKICDTPEMETGTQTKLEVDSGTQTPYFVEKGIEKDTNNVLSSKHVTEDSLINQKSEKVPILAKRNFEDIIEKRIDKLLQEIRIFKLKGIVTDQRVLKNSAVLMTTNETVVESSGSDISVNHPIPGQCTFTNSDSHDDNTLSDIGKDENGDDNTIPFTDEPKQSNSTSGKWLIPILERLNIDILQGRVIVSKSPKSLHVKQQETLQESPNNCNKTSKDSENDPEEMDECSSMWKKIEEKVKSTSLSPGKRGKKRLSIESCDFSPRITRNKALKALKGLAQQQNTEENGTRKKRKVGSKVLQNTKKRGRAKRNLESAPGIAENEKTDSVKRKLAFEKADGDHEEDLTVDESEKNIEEEIQQNLLSPKRGRRKSNTLAKSEQKKVVSSLSDSEEMTNCIRKKRKRSISQTSNKNANVKTKSIGKSELFIETIEHVANQDTCVESFIIDEPKLKKRKKKRTDVNETLENGDNGDIEKKSTFKKRKRKTKTGIITEALLALENELSFQCGSPQNRTNLKTPNSKQTKEIVKSATKSSKKMLKPSVKSLKKISGLKRKKTSLLKNSPTSKTIEKNVNLEKVSFRLVTEPAEQKILKMKAAEMKKLCAVKHCGYCQMKVFSRHYCNHIQMNHPYRCARCCLLFESKTEKANHKKEKHNAESFKCITCDRIFDGKFRYVRHIKASGHRNMIKLYKRAVSVMKACLGLDQGIIKSQKYTLFAKRKCSSHQDLSKRFHSKTGKEFYFEFIEQAILDVATYFFILNPRENDSRRRAKKRQKHKCFIDICISPMFYKTSSATQKLPMLTDGCSTIGESPANNSQNTLAAPEQVGSLFLNVENEAYSKHEPEVQNLLTELSDLRSHMLCLSNNSNSYALPCVGMQSSQSTFCNYNVFSEQITRNSEFYANDNAQFNELPINRYTSISSERQNSCGTNFQSVTVPCVVQNFSLESNSNSSSSSSTVTMDESYINRCIENHSNQSDMSRISDTQKDETEKSPNTLISDVFQMLENDGYFENGEFRTLNFEKNPVNLSDIELSGELSGLSDKQLTDWTQDLYNIQDHICNKNKDSNENYSLLDISSQRVSTLKRQCSIETDSNHRFFNFDYVNQQSNGSRQETNNVWSNNSQILSLESTHQNNALESSCVQNPSWESLVQNQPMNSFPSKVHTVSQREQRQVEAEFKAILDDIAQIESNSL